MSGGAGPSFATHAAVLCLLPFLVGCATARPSASPERPEAPPHASIVSVRAIGLDQFRSKISFTLTLANPGGRALALESYDCSIRVEGAEAGRLVGHEAPAIEAGASASLPLEFIVDARTLDDGVSGPSGPATAAFRIEAKVVLCEAGGGPAEVAGEAGRIALSATDEGSFPLVREPRLRILSLKIARDILVTVNLQLAIEVYNPNAFPVELGSLAYDFYGEGNPWSGGKEERHLLVPARSSGKLALAFELNFADRDRALFDLVANLSVIQYRLEGEGEVATGLGYLPTFHLEFDEEGSCRVER
jgi:LEA14-like dessication related protein